jgi:hypothetical protein
MSKLLQARILATANSVAGLADTAAAAGRDTCRSNPAREAFVEMCKSDYVQRMTFDSYLYKTGEHPSIVVPRPFVEQ